ncbi:MAG: isoprenyl transferase [Deltaproteobacteria bacterium]|nr:isoprenyl transferase [Deltaproteobacteria bacterium]MBW1941358.1 isoprenyl transferase [Deltaproteobacteria bacterium]MBW2205343.1 isoprenyl transferase [Deltaproteobacteria bacterium]
MSSIDPEKLPKHVAIIMDGNGRWAKKKAFNRIRGHEEGAKSVREIVRTSRETGIRWLTLYAFSEENWKRPAYEIKALMKLLKSYLKGELEEMLENNIRFQTIGRTGKLPKDVQETIRQTLEKTAGNKGMTLSLALSYGSRQEMVDTVKTLARRVQAGEISPEDINEKLIGSALYTADMPDPDLLIRTSGEYRVSNFLLWQIAYTELYITPTLWPEFRKEEYLTAIEEYQKRERRFGATSDQLADKER